MCSRVVAEFGKRLIEYIGKSATLPFFALAVTFGGCSMHPMPDDVTEPIRTEDIIRHARCEIRREVLNQLRQLLTLPTDDALIQGVESLNKRLSDVNKKIAAQPGITTASKSLTESEQKLLLLADVAIAYDFDFNITEQNSKEGAVAFKIPFTSPAAFDLSGGASLRLTRQGQRQFKAGEKWGSLLTKKVCDDLETRSRNALYPISGSMGLDKLIASFVNISRQGGAKDSFVETLIFTTEISGGVNAGLKLNAVPHDFRLVSAGGSLAGGRKDIHKMVVSLVFPYERGARPLVGVELNDGFLNAPFDRPTLWRARYNICVADARSREDAFKMLRHEAPEVYCIEYADAFAPSGKRSTGPKTVAAARTSATRSQDGAARSATGIRPPPPVPPQPQLYYQRRDDKITR